VLREMIKSANLQLKAREKEHVRLKSKLTYAEGKNLAARQRFGEHTGSMQSLQSSQTSSLQPRVFASAANLPDLRITKSNSKIQKMQQVISSQRLLKG